MIGWILFRVNRIGDLPVYFAGLLHGPFFTGYSPAEWMAVALLGLVAVAHVIENSHADYTHLFIEPLESLADDCSARAGARHRDLECAEGTGIPVFPLLSRYSPALATARAPRPDISQRCSLLSSVLSHTCRRRAASLRFQFTSSSVRNTISRSAARPRKPIVRVMSFRPDRHSPGAENPSAPGR